MPVAGSRGELEDRNDKALDWRLYPSDVTDDRRRTFSKEENDPDDLCRTLRPGVPGVPGVEASVDVVFLLGARDARLRLRFIDEKIPLVVPSWTELAGELAAGLELQVSSSVSA